MQDINDSGWIAGESGAAPNTGGGPAASGEIRDLFLRTLEEIEKVVYGQRETAMFCLAALFSNGHVLLEGVPGIAKTTLVRTIAATLSMSVSRIQFTPDLLPNDITGTHVYREDSGSFEFREGPVFANFVLADEINRAPAKTQSALLEAMQEGTVSQDREVRALPKPFTVFATQNPVEHEGTYPLPLAQLDRFMFKVLVEFPDAASEERMLAEHHCITDPGSVKSFNIAKVVDSDAVLNAREVIRGAYVRPEVITYVQSLMAASRDDANLMVGASPRGGLALLMGAKSLARFEGREFVTPDDIKAAFLPALRHRVVLAPTAELEGMPADDALLRVLDRVKVPR